MLFYVLINKSSSTNPLRTPECPFKIQHSVGVGPCVKMAHINYSTLPHDEKVIPRTKKAINYYY